MCALAVRRALLLTSRCGLPRQGMMCVRPAGALLPSRAFSSAAGAKVGKALTAEIAHEQEQYEQSKEIKAFLKDGPFKLQDIEGDVNLQLVREVGDKTVTIEWQLTTPFDPSMNPDADPSGEGQESETTDFSVTVENKSGSGMAFYCSTQAGEDHRFVIGNVTCFSNAEQKESVSAYNGPEFEDLDDILQKALDEYLAECGMDDDVCNFIDAMAMDKEQREYTTWLQTVQKFIE